MPVRVIGHSGNPYPILHFEEYPLLTAGESISVGGYTITVRSGGDHPDVLTITRDKLTLPAAARSSCLAGVRA